VTVKYKRTMKRFNFLFLILSFSLNFFAQESINAAGGNIVGSGGSVAFSVGQVFYKSYSASGITECQGIQKAREYYNDVTPPAPIDFEISNYMSPNNDGQNDTWKISDLSKVKDFAISIVDMWGNKVFSVNNNYNNEFDGTDGGKKLQDGVYYYVISENGKTKHTGSITLLR
jgi:gliding motility-associated-like protein